VLDPADFTEDEMVEAVLGRWVALDVKVIQTPLGIFHS
jgi:hypothetical protein